MLVATSEARRRSQLGRILASAYINFSTAEMLTLHKREETILRLVLTSNDDAASPLYKWMRTA
ncbi:hypothetical protein QIS74_06691 [Colletotrichum tabaci]|uniref:Uncharacterized protein n=1 Tax=Colletotrichum tabaci TaxID=1209068 RepID=A0AAV9TBK3_9PEZI